MSLKDQILSCLLSDRKHLLKRWYALRSLSQSQRSEQLAKLQSKIDHSCSIVQARQKPISLEYPNLPVSHAKETILEMLNQHQVILVASETGSGKSTQLAKMCLEAGRGVFGWVGHTQPRRLAARTVADRVAQEMHESLGQTIGFKVRFSEKVAVSTRVKVMTDGILLNELQTDPLLLNYDTIIIDEAHERSLNIDLLLGTIKLILKKRSDLKVIITSATIALEKFSQFFDGAPCLTIEGKVFPVGVTYLPRLEDEDYFAQVRRGIDAALHATQGDLLVFLSGEGEIHQAQKMLKDLPSRIEVLPLFARLSLQEQRRVYHPSGKRRIILSTNVAETSLTVPNISAVVDTGFARISRYSYRSKIQRLPIEPVSQSSCQQRKGRAGRVREGQCFRLFSEEDFESRPLDTEPEIQRTNLAAVILRMSMLNLGQIDSFPFIDAPDPRYIRDGIKQLERLEALSDHKLTPLGKKMAQMPIEPKLARILISAQQYLALEEVLIIVSGLSIQDPREYPKQALEKAQTLHAQFSHPKSNFMELLNLWQHLKAKQSELSGSEFRKYCAKNFIHPLRWFEWQDVYHQLKSLCRDLKFKFNTLDAHYDGIHKALLSGFFETIGRQSEDKQGYDAPRGVQFKVPRQKLKAKPKWVMASHLIETKQVFASLAAEIQPLWVEEVAKHCCKYQVTELFWDSRTGYIKSLSQVTFFGLVIQSKKPTPLSKAGPEAKHLFIREALIEHGLPQFEFWRHNQAVINQLRDLEARIRRPDSILDLESLFEFYDKHLPENIHSVVNLKSFIKQKGEQALFISPDDIALSQNLDSILAQYPDTYVLNDIHLKLSYVFDLDSDKDGVTIHIPIGLAQSIRHHDFSWAIPGLIDEQLEWILNRLLKSYRRRLPTVRECLELLPKKMNRDVSFPLALVRSLRAEFQVPITESELKGIPIPDYMQLRYEVLDGEVSVGAGRDFAELFDQLGEHLEQNLTPKIESSHFKKWDFNDLPISRKKLIEGQSITVYPALVDNQDSVSLEDFSDQTQALQAHLCGLIRLMMLVDSKNGRDLIKHIGNQKCLKKQAKSLLDEHNVLIDLVRLSYHYCCLDLESLPRTQKAFEQALSQGKPKLAKVLMKLSKLIEETLELYQEIQWLMIKAKREKGHLVNASLEDIEQQCRELFQPQFILKTPVEWLLRYPSYIQAVKVRIEKLLTDPLQEADKLRTLKPFIKEFNRLCPVRATPACQHFRWALEEYRITLFAQPMKAKLSVSPKKLKIWLREIV